MKRYRSRISYWILLPILFLVSLEGVIMALTGLWLGILASLAFIILILYLYLDTYYVIGAGVLKIRGGFLVKEHIQIETISRIEETRDPAAAPALSLDRLRIYYLHKTILVSPSDKEGFVLELQKNNPAIEFVNRKSNRPALNIK